MRTLDLCSLTKAEEVDLCHSRLRTDQDRGMIPSAYHILSATSK